MTKNEIFEWQQRCNAAIAAVGLLWRLTCLSMGLAVGVVALLAGAHTVAMWSAGLAIVGIVGGVLAQVLAAVVVAGWCVWTLIRGVR